MRLLRRRPKSFEIQVQDLVLHITAPEDFAEESRAAALSFWEQLQSYALRYPTFRQSKRPLDRITADAPDIVKEMVHDRDQRRRGPDVHVPGRRGRSGGAVPRRAAARAHASPATATTSSGRASA